jgi:hypothetical protein
MAGGDAAAKQSPMLNITRHALPLTVVRFSCPRSSRGVRARNPRRGNEEGQGSVHESVLDSYMTGSHPRLRQVRRQVIAVAFPEECPCPRPVHIHRQGASATHPHIRKLRAVSAACPRKGTGRKLVSDAASSRPIRSREHSSLRPRDWHHHHPGTSAHARI